MHRRILQLVVMMMLVGMAAAQQPAPGMPKPAQGQPSSNGPDQTAPLAPQKPAAVEPMKPLYQEENSAEPAPEPAATPVAPVTGISPGNLAMEALPFGAELNTTFRASQSVSSVPDLNGPPSDNWRGVGSVGANLSFQSRWRNGGTFLYDGVAAWNSRREDDPTHLHRAGFSQPVRFGRVGLTFADQFSYLPQGGGFNGMQGLGGLGITDLTGSGLVPTTLNTDLVPDESIIAANSPRIVNTSAVQAEYALSARTSITTSFSYGLLHSIDYDLQNNRQYNTSVGVSRRLTARDSVGLSYAYSAYTWDSIDQDVRNQQVGVTYGRKVNSRMDFSAQVSAQFNTTSMAGLDRDNLFWGSRVGLTYNRKGWSVGLNYLRSVTGGSGVLPGARTDRVFTSVGRPFGRKWMTNTNFGYARNSAIAGATAFDTFFGGASLFRHLGGAVSMFVSYEVERQQVSGPCLGIACTDGRFHHTGAIGLSFGLRPVRLR